MGRRGSERNTKAVMRLATERKPRMRLALGDGRQDPSPEPWPRKVNMRLAQTSGCTPTERSDADGTHGNELWDCEVARATPRRGHAGDGVSPLSSSQGCTPSATASASPERPDTLERLEYPVLTQAAAALAELAHSQARAAGAAEALRLEREARGRDEAAHGAERERLQHAAAELQMQLAALRREYCGKTSDACDHFEMERPTASQSQGATDALRAARAEAQLLPHGEIAERCRVEYAESEARRRLTDSSRAGCAASAAEPRGASGSLAILQSRSVADSPAARATHPDAGWFLTLDIIALSVAPFAPRRWAPVCRDTAEAVCNVHRFWHNASCDVQDRMRSSLGQFDDGNSNEWSDPLLAWKVLIHRVGHAPPGDHQDDLARLELRARTVHSVLQQHLLDYQDVMHSMWSTNERIRATRQAMREVLGK